MYEKCFFLFFGLFFNTFATIEKLTVDVLKAHMEKKCEYGNLFHKCNLCEKNSLDDWLDKVVQKKDFSLCKNLNISSSENRVIFDFLMSNMYFLTNKLILLVQVKSYLSEGKIRPCFYKILKKIKKHAERCEAILLKNNENGWNPLFCHSHWKFEEIYCSLMGASLDSMDSFEQYVKTAPNSTPFIESIRSLFLYYDQRLNLVSLQKEIDWEELYKYYQKNETGGYRIFFSDNKYTSFNGEFSDFALVLSHPDYVFDKKIRTLKSKLSDIFFLSEIYDIRQDFKAELKKIIIEKFISLNSEYIECLHYCEHIMREHKKSNIFLGKQSILGCMLDSISLDENSTDSDFIFAFNKFAELKRSSIKMNEVNDDELLDEIDLIALCVNKKELETLKWLEQILDLLFQYKNEKYNIYNKIDIEEIDINALEVGSSVSDLSEFYNTYVCEDLKNTEQVNNNLNFFIFTQSSFFLEKLHVNLFEKKMQFGITGLYFKDSLNFGGVLKFQMNDSFNISISYFKNNLIIGSISFLLFSNFNFMISIDNKENNVFLSFSYFLSSDVFLLDFNVGCFFCK